jgi:superfamily II DNA helicase RecQ
MPTGGGKSLCYQIPALLREGTGLVVSPLIALMQDQVTALRELGIEAEFLNSSQSPEERREVMAKLRQGSLQLLYVAPERLVTEHTKALLRDIPLSIIAIDEQRIKRGKKSSLDSSLTSPNASSRSLIDPISAMRCRSKPMREGNC